jgi:glutathione S-transferase
MIEVHHLNESRSRRITWMLEELGLPYEVIRYQRDAATRLAPPELMQVHPLGKAPVLRDDDLVLIESGAIIDYLVRQYGQGRFAPAPESKDYHRYVQFMHYAEGSAMLPLMLNLYVGRLREAGAPLQPRIQSELDKHFGYLNDCLGHQHYLVGNAFSGADVQMSFVAQMAIKVKGRDAFPHLASYVDRLEARPAYQQAASKHGE